MGKLKIICPNCRSLLSIEETPGIVDKMLSCPICRFRAKVSVYQQQVLGSGKHGGDDDEEPPQVHFGMMDRTIGSIFHGTQEYSLPTNPKNPIKVNGRLLQNTDIVVLQWGDRLTFGHTELVFERPHFNEEQTMIEE